METCQHIINKLFRTDSNVPQSNRLVQKKYIYTYFVVPTYRKSASNLPHLMLLKGISTTHNL